MPVLKSAVPTTSQSEIDLIVHGNAWDPFATAEALLVSDPADPFPEGLPAIAA